MNSTLSDLQWSTCLVYLDDIIIFSRTLEEHLQRLRSVLDRFITAGLKLKPSKCHLLKQKVSYLGHIISREGVATDPAKIESLRKWATPINVDQVRSFMGLATYYRRFIPAFADISTPLRRLTEKNVAFTWTDVCDRAFGTLKEKLTSSPVLAFPCFDKEFTLDTEASESAIGAVLSQTYEDGERVIAYGSRSLTKAERRYSITRKELLALVYFIKHFKHYLYGCRFTVRTDHSALKWLHSFKEPEGQVARWIQELETYNFQVQHRPGVAHQNTDALSRVPTREDYSTGSHPIQVTILQNGPTPSLAADTTNDDRCEHTHKPTGGWIPTWSSQQLRDAQVADAKIGPMLQWIENPSRRDTCGNITHRLWAERDRLVRIHGVLYRRGEDTEGHQSHLKLIVPQSFVPSVLQELHNGPFAGHLGYFKTLCKVRARFYWPGLTKDVRRWCRECRQCASRKSNGQTPRAPLLTSQVGQPMERVALDILGPLPLTERRNKYIVVIGDYYTKWIEAFAIPNQEAKTVAKIFFDEFVCRFGAPTYLHTDQGRNFESTLFKELCLLLGIKKTRTTPFTPSRTDSSKGSIEPWKTCSACMSTKTTPTGTCIYNTSCWPIGPAYKKRRDTPHFLLTGREVTLPTDVMFGHTPEVPRPVPEYVAHVRNTLEAAFRAVRDRTQAQQRRQKTYYDRRCHGNPYSVGDLVWLHVPYVKRGQTRKLHRPWHGPYLIAKKLSDSTYRIKSIDGKRKRQRQIVHFDRLKPCTEPVDSHPAAPETAGVGSEDVVDNEPGATPAGAPETTMDSTAELYAEETELGGWPSDEPRQQTNETPSVHDRTPPTRPNDSDIDTTQDQSIDPIPSPDHLSDPPTPDHYQSELSSRQELILEDTVTERERQRRPPAWARDYEFYT